MKPTIAQGSNLAGPICLYPDNPHYFFYQGKPVQLITAGEHYGSVLNLDFDYSSYLPILNKYQLNLTRLFSGAYIENEKDIAWMGYGNTLAPRAERFISPWKRSESDGYPNGGCKFDLDQWDEAYFQRLKDFIHQAAANSIIVEYVFFSQMYGDSQWNISPLNVKCNINGVGTCPWDRFTTLDDSILVARQEQLIRKVIRELNVFKNIYFEICNEPNTSGEQAGIDWHNAMIETILSEESGLPNQHLIAVNYDQPYAIQRIHPKVSICNVHYTWGDGWVGAMELLDHYYTMPMVLAMDETMGFGAEMSADQARVEAWEAMTGGCAVYDHLSWAFTPENEQGNTGEHQAFLSQMQKLREFMDGFDLSRIAADPGILAKGFYDGVHARALVETGKQYAIYIHYGCRNRQESDACYLVMEGAHECEIGLWIPKGNYRIEWINPASGAILSSQALEHTGKMMILASPQFPLDIALRIISQR